MRDQLEQFRSRCLTPEEMEENKKKETGCVDPEYGAKAKAKLQLVFVPRKKSDLKHVHPLRISPDCLVTRIRFDKSRFKMSSLGVVLFCLHEKKYTHHVKV